MNLILLLQHVHCVDYTIRLPATEQADLLSSQRKSTFDKRNTVMAVALDGSNWFNDIGHSHSTNSCTTARAGSDELEQRQRLQCVGSESGTAHTTHFAISSCACGFTLDY